MEAQPLAGRRVLVTRSAHQAGKLSEALRALGAEPVEVPVLEICPPLNIAPLNEALRQIDAYDWLILTSANTVRSIAWGSVLDRMSQLRVAAVGEATAAAAKAAGLPVTVVPKTYVAEALVEQITASIAGQRVLLACAEITRDVIPDALRAAGAQVDVVEAYRNVMPEAAPRLLREALENGIDAATFTSSSSVTHLADAARTARIAFPFAGVPAISIGPITSKTLRELGWEPEAEADRHDIPGLIAALQRAFPS